jgi:cytosine/adenosine deaminase-related metal-dependent hydrolase
MATDLLIHDVRPLGGDPTDILILAGRIAAGSPPAGVPVLEGGGRIALPGLVEAHTHLDKSLLGLPWYRNEVGPRLIDKIENERQVRRMLPIDPRRQSELQARLSVSHGSTFIRSHVDVDTECGVAGIEGVMAEGHAGAARHGGTAGTGIADGRRNGRRTGPVRDRSRPEGPSRYRLWSR